MDHQQIELVDTTGYIKADKLHQKTIVGYGSQTIELPFFVTYGNFECATPTEIARLIVKIYCAGFENGVHKWGIPWK